jgi:hypothetical protein
VFRRFGDRGLTGALLDDYMREFQDAFLQGALPLGPGAPATDRLEAFIVELIQRQADHLDLALAAEVPPGQALAPTYGALILHIEVLVLEVDTAELQAAARAFLRGMTT